MKPEDKLALSFYREVEPIGKKDNVFLVRHSETGEFFVKKIYTHYDSDIYKFLSENRLYGIPSIRLTIHDDDKLIVIEEYINGSTLQDIVEKQGKIFAPNEVAGILSRLCEILQQFHNATPQLVHRDIKPSNIIISQTGEIFLTDFNISRQVKENKNTDTEIMGTFGYAAPEQYGFEQCTDKTDIYALGGLPTTVNLSHVQFTQGTLLKHFHYCSNRFRSIAVSLCKRRTKGKNIIPPLKSPNGHWIPGQYNLRDPFFSNDGLSF